MPATYMVFMPESAEYAEYMHFMDALSSATTEQLDALSHQFSDFPHGIDGFVGRRWIINAIDCGSKLAVEWMLGRQVDLSFRDQEGYTVLHSAIDRQLPHKHDILTLLLDAGAPVNARGIDDFTPAHLAAALDDVEALKRLVNYGADLTIRTTIDGYETPVEVARLGKCLHAIEFLENHA